MATAKKAEPKLAVSKGKLGFTVTNTYTESAKKVWEAVTKAKKVQKFFVDKVTGDFTEEMASVEWYWKKWGAFTLTPTVVQKEKKLEFTWANHQNTYLTTVTFTLTKEGKHTQLQIHERGWIPADQKNAFDNCEGWTTYLCYLKGMLEEGVDLRTKHA